MSGWRLRRIGALPDDTTDGRSEWCPVDVRGLSLLDYRMADAQVTVAGGVAQAIKVGRPDTQGMRAWIGKELPEKMPGAWLDALLVAVRTDLQEHWARVEALAVELQWRWWLWGKRATAVIETAV